ncbi:MULTISPECIES: thermonuclease family protein [unclassified Arthrobacter]|uniref:thermonuclease family protein n=1 Tax=unclassified Arthrobacter TaxID=235627 RepID=UPI002E0CEE99|nr:MULTISPECIES: thermonuclease family protein [unclassified Arthrobacter]MEC5190696.1 micrococcal nuclease [Arthrobacter sp. MP_M4]MEC5202780.1 micrococcal nuclease [Arthrobacter sp. MP_M7]
MLSEEQGTAARARTLGLVVAAALTLAGCNAGTASLKRDAAAETSSRTQATVVRVIDGDTFEASVNNEQKTVRLLNVDTPETKDPNAPVECMGPEATKALEQLLPAGSKVELELDKEPLDKFGRMLAGVFDSHGKLVNAEIARLGLGVPVLFEPNRKFHPPVVAAFEEARTNGIGLTSADVPCLPAQQVELAVGAVETLVAAPLADVNVDLDKSHTALVAALALLAALKAAASVKDHVLWTAYTTDRRTVMVTRLDAAASAGKARQAAISAKKKHIADAAAAESARQVADAAAAESARQVADAAAAAEAERLRNVPPPAPYVPPARVPPANVAPAAPAPAPNPYPGYNGPRCYAPGGKSWTPCSKR